jgi:tetratricopeptide (TPR) repeat protein
MDPQAFLREMEAGSALERALRWEEAAAHYGRLVDHLRSVGGDEGVARMQRARAALRHGSALMELSRWEEARTALDGGIEDAKASGNGEALAQALLAGGVYAMNRADFPRAEAFLMEALDRFHRSDDPASLAGRGWTFLNLALLYGKTGRLDLAFVTLTKAQDVLGAAEDWGGVAAAWEAQAQLRRAIGDEDRWREDLAEAVVFYDREGMDAKATRLRGLLGRKVV